MPVETFDASTTWQAPAGIVSPVTVECWGGGGAGGVSVKGGRGGGGGGGAYASKDVAVTALNNYTVTVGVGGISDVTGPGEPSWFSSSLEVLAKEGTGGGPGYSGIGGLGIGGPVSSSVGTVKRAGGNGSDGQASTGGGGGGSATSSAAGGAASGANGGTGEGGGATATTGDGANGTAPGGGGAGAGNAGSLGGNGAAGRVRITYTISVTPPTAAFTGTPLSGTSPLSVAFTDSSTNTPTSWLWEKSSDGGSNWSNFASGPTTQNPTESFTAGTWAVRLTATNAGGSDGETKLAYVTVTAAATGAVRRMLMGLG